MQTENDQITNLLMILLVVLLAVLFILVVVYLILLVKKNKKESNKKNDNIKGKTKSESKTSTNGTKSILDFMEFDNIEDNMIIQKEKVKYLMVVECQGVNYDLMSEVEKVGVEESFLQFLNTLRHPIQLYVQTRTIDLGSSINAYKKRVYEIETELNRKKQQYDEMIESRRYTKQQKQRMLFEITKQRNLYEYGKDIIADTERTSLNKNILNKKYYVIIPYYPSDAGEGDFDESELRNMAFSELYTRSQAVIRTLSGCGVKGKILNTRELIDLLYVAYNRDQSEDFGLDKALMAQYDKLYSTSEDIYDKKMRELDRIIEEKAVEKAVSKVEKIRSRKEEEAIEKEQKMDELINEMAKIIIQGNKDYIEEEVAEEAVQELEEEDKQYNVDKEVVDNGKKEAGKETT